MKIRLQKTTTGILGSSSRSKVVAVGTKDGLVELLKQALQFAEICSNNAELDRRE
jgi:hypothetical protein